MTAVSHPCTHVNPVTTNTPMADITRNSINDAQEEG